MSDLTDLEICKRIAEIEGVVIEHQEYNPLTDDALCFRLMVKYRVDVRHYIYGTVSARIIFYQEVTGSDANEAICLAIIEANSND